MIDKESKRTLTGWLRMGDRVAGRKPVEGICDRCHEMGYLSPVANEKLCASCYLENAAS